MFKAFFQETVQEKWKTAFHVRVVNISFFLEDGTIKIVEPSVDNSGLEQGLTVHLIFIIFLYRYFVNTALFYLYLILIFIYVYTFVFYYIQRK